MKKFVYAVTALLFSTQLQATQLAPWFGPDLQIEGKATVLLQEYQHIALSHGQKRHHAFDQFYTLGADVSAFGYSAELEGTLANTHHQPPAVDNIRLTGRYLVMNDVAAEDPISLAVGLTLTKAFEHSVHDISSFHHGQIEGELHAAAGKEFACGNFWTTHAWGVLGIGQADVGSPWIHADAHWEMNWWNLHQLDVFAKSLWGTGGNNIRKHHRSFHGYGPIAHRSIDLGLKYNYIFENDAVFSTEYAFRVFARNFPCYANLLVIKFLYPFGI